MRKQFQKVKEKAEGYLARPNRSELPEDLKETERRVEKFRKLVQLLEKKIIPQGVIGQRDESVREKRKKKIYEFTFAVAIEELEKDLPESSLKTSLSHCLTVQKELAQEKIKNEEAIEDKVWNELHQLLNKLDAYQRQKTIEAKCASDYEQAKGKYENAKNTSGGGSKSKSVESQQKIEQYKEEMEECETRLDKERDIYVSLMYDLLAEEETVVRCLLHYISFQEAYYTEAKEFLAHAAQHMREIKVNGRVFGTPLQEHLESSQRQIAFVIELAVSHLLHKGIHEEGLFRVGCMNHKLMRLKAAIDAGQYTHEGFRDYHDPHVFAALLKTYLRELPDPLLTHALYGNFIELATLPPGDATKERISKLISRLPVPNYDNLRYLMCFLYRFSKELSKTRMTTQNIAIVVSPNLLWVPEDIALKQSTYDAQMNSTTAVSVIVEQLISEYPYFFGAEVELGIADLNGGFTDDISEPKTAAVKSQLSSSSSVCYTTGGNVMTMSQNNNSGYQKIRTPAGSDGTSQINLGLPRSGSSNSVSDAGTDAPTSPKLPVRKNKKAPVPPQLEKHEAQTQTGGKKPLVRTTSTEDLGAPSGAVHNQMYGYHTMGRSASSRTRPSPLPRSTITNEKIYENTEVQVREKPLVPERPANLPVRPTSKPVTDFHSPPASAPATTTDNNHEPLLRQTSISTIEKQQVSIIDLNPTKSTTSKKPPTGRDNSAERTEQFITHESSGNNGDSVHLQQVPRSPRGISSAPNVKRPQIPAPPPPNRKSGDGSDSTNL